MNEINPDMVLPGGLLAGWMLSAGKAVLNQISLVAEYKRRTA